MDMEVNKRILMPEPIMNSREIAAINLLKERYDKLQTPGTLAKIGNKAVSIVPDKVKTFGSDISNSISELEIFKQAMEMIADGFKIVEEQAANYSISEKDILKKVNEIHHSFQIEELSELCFVRSYSLSRLVNNYKKKDKINAFVEGGVTGAFGFWGLPFNLVLSTFLYFRAVQSIAMFYGYDVKNESAEMVIAGEVFSQSLSPVNNDVNNEVSGIIVKIMVMTQASVVHQTAKKTWTDMAMRRGIPLLLTQMRALANKYAQTALNKAGAKGLERSVFKEVFEQIGKKLALKTVQKSVPVVSSVLGALIDTSQMNKVLEFADIFYQKRFLLEKEERIMTILDTKKTMFEDITVETEV